MTTTSPWGGRFTTLAEFAALNPESWSKNTAPEGIEYVDLANTKWGVVEATQRYDWSKDPSRAQRISRVRFEDDCRSVIQGKFDCFVELWKCTI